MKALALLYLVGTVGQSCPCSVTCDRGLAPSEGTTGDKADSGFRVWGYPCRQRV